MTSSQHTKYNIRRPKTEKKVKQNRWPSAQLAFFGERSALRPEQIVCVFFCFFHRFSARDSHASSFIKVCHEFLSENSGKNNATDAAAAAATAKKRKEKFSFTEKS